MPERLHAAEQIFESVEDSRKEELRTKLERLDEARSRILADAGARVLTKGEKKAIMRWMKRDRKEETWPLDDNITRDNYQARLAPYEVLDLVDPDFITGKNDIYNLVNRQYVTFLEELQRVERQPKRFHLVQGGVEDAPVAPAVPVAETGPAAPPVERESGGEQPPEEQKKSWKVWEMIFALLHAMQKYPEQFEELKNLSPDALNEKLTKEGPRLVNEYMQIASRGQMEWDEEKKMWGVLDQTKLPNMDVKVGLLVLERAGFKVEMTPERLQLVPPGNEAVAKPFVLQFDTMDTEKRKRLEEAAKAKGASVESMHIENTGSPDTDLKPGEYRVTVDHHTDDPRERKTSGAQLMYDYLTAAGLLERDQTLERLLALTNANDNGEFPADRDFYLRSASTLWGIGSDSRVPASVLYNIMARGRKPEDQLAEEDLNEAINEGLTVRELVANKEKQIEKDAKEFDRWSREGYVIDTDYGPLYICLDVDGRYMPKQTVARAYGGVPNVLIWSPEKHSFFIALGGGKSFKQDVKFPEGTEIIRRHLAIFKRQARTPQELEASLTEILYPFSPKKRRDLKGDLRAYVFGTIDTYTSNETLFSIYTNTPEKQGAVIEELVRYPQRLRVIKRLSDETRGETQRIYKEMFDRAQQKLTPIEEDSAILDEYKALKAAEASKKAKSKKRPHGENSEG